VANAARSIRSPDAAPAASTLACVPHRIFLWPGTPLLTKFGHRFAVRPRDRVYDVVCRLHGPRAAWAPLLPTLERAADLLNGGDVAAARACLDGLALPPLSRAGADLMRAIAERHEIAPLDLPVARDDGAGLRRDLAAGLAEAYEAIDPSLWALSKVAAARLALLDRYFKNPNVRAFLDVIAQCEGANYNTLYGGKTFDSYATFPGSGKHSPSGRYQITKMT
jgi:hypothetical protein